METKQTAQRIFELLSYNPEDGSFTWKTKRRGRKQAGMSAGCIHPNGYIRISIDCRLYYAQRLAWLFITGDWPPNHIDHIDGNRSNNRPNNLREATVLQNGANRKTCKLNTSGIKGVSFIKSSKKWGAWIKIAGKSKNLGSYKTKEEAAQAYKEAAEKFFGKFAKIK